MLTPGYYQVAQMGHTVHYGFVQEVEIAGAKMLQIDIPAVAGEIVEDEYDAKVRHHVLPLPAEQLTVTPGSLFSLRTTTEETVMTLRKSQRPYGGRIINDPQLQLPMMEE